MVELASTVWADGPASMPYEPQKHQIRRWGAWVEGIITAFTSNGGLIYSSKAVLDLDLSKPANSMAWVLGDPIAANNGIYRKSGATTPPGWWSRVSDLPFSFIVAEDAGTGMPNAIQAETSIPVSGSALVWMNIATANTGSPVTVSFNDGPALTIKTNSGNDPTVGGLAEGMIVTGIVSGSSFRLLSDQVSSAIVASVEAMLADVIDLKAEVDAALAGVTLPAAVADTILVQKPDASGYSAKTFPEVRDLIYELRGCYADGVTADDANFAAFEAQVTGRVVDMRGKSFRIRGSAPPGGNIYVNGGFIGAFENWEDTNDLTQVHWAKQAVTIGGTSVILPNAVNGSHYLGAPFIPASPAYPLLVSVNGRAAGYSFLRIRLTNAITGAFLSDVVFDFTTGTVITGPGETISNADGNGFRTAVSKFVIPAGVTLVNVQFWVFNTADGAAYAGDGVKGFELRDMKFGGMPIPALQTPAMISSNSDTGGVGSAYAGGVYGNLVRPGRTTPHLFAGIAIHGSRVGGPSRAGLLATIYSSALGNVSGAVATRHTYICIPQGFAAGCEEILLKGGFRAVAVASIDGHLAGESNFMAACRGGTMLSGRNASAMSCTLHFGGRGGGWQGLATYANGQITGMSTLRNLYGDFFVGRGYAVGDKIATIDRMTGASDADVRVASVGSIGQPLTFNILNGGTNYGTTPAPDGNVYIDATIDNDTGDFSAGIANVGYTQTEGAGSAIIASYGSENFWTKNKGATSLMAGCYQVENEATLASILGVTSSYIGNVARFAAIASDNIEVAAASINNRSLIMGYSATPISKTGNNQNITIRLEGNGGRLRSQNGAVTGGFDYAELYYNLLQGTVIPDGSPIGLVLDEGRMKVRIAEPGDFLLGAKSINWSVLGNNPIEYHAKYLVNAYGRVETEEREFVSWPEIRIRGKVEFHLTEQDVIDDATGKVVKMKLPEQRQHPDQIVRETYSGLRDFAPMEEMPKDATFWTDEVPILNPEYDPTLPYIDREKRPLEYTPVGTHGQVPMNVDATVQAGDFITIVTTGVGSKADVLERAICMEITEAFDAERGFAVALVQLI